MKTIIVTGCSRGIGEAIAAHLAAAGHQVIGTSTDGKATLKYVKVFPLDLSNPISIKKFHQSVSNQRIDVLINCAAILLEKWNNPQINMDQLKQTFDVNVFGLIELTEKLIPQINKGGHIINFSSGWGAICNNNVDEFAPHYKLSKAAVNMYTLLLARRLEGSITVSAIDPGWVRTDMGGKNASRKPEEVVPEILRLIEKDVPSGRFWKNNRERSW